jgi:hypothetical protein
MSGSRIRVAWIGFAVVAMMGATFASASEPIQVGFHWHMHQPIYFPYESPLETDANGRFSFSVVDVHNQRFGPYTSWPYDAVLAGSGLPHLGAQVSFSGALIENLNDLAAAGVNGGMWTNWTAAYNQGIALQTVQNQSRLELVAFGYHHPLMPLLGERDIRMQIRLHRHLYQQTWSGSYSNGIFPPETAFSTRMIPALVAEGIDWVLVDNIHFDRACQSYPHTNQSGIYAPNRADQINPDPAATGGAWVQLTDLWAPSAVSVPFGYQPHHVQHVDPATGDITRIVAVPGAHYEGHEDARGGYGAFLYDAVMDQYLAYNTDPDRPMFVVLHHDGDNFGGGGESYYHHNFQNMLNWVSTDPDYDVTTIADYLLRFPPPASDVIHVEDGSWAGADGGDPEFKKWLGDPDASGWSPDRNSWAVLTAARHRVFMADDLAPATDLQNILDGTGTLTEQAWHWLLVSQASDYWYWDGTETWDNNVTRGCNQAVAFADQVLDGAADTTPPTIFVPQREPYNPGGYEWGSGPEPNDFEVWTFAYDAAGLDSVTLRWRIDNDGANPLASIENETYAGGSEVGAWNDIPMTASDVTPPPGILTPTYRAERYGGWIVGQEEVLIDYYVEAVDTNGNLARSPIRHVYVGVAGGTGGGDIVTVEPDPPVAGEDVTIAYNPGGRPLANAPQVLLHYGFNGWNPIIAPDPAMTWNEPDGVWEITVPVLSFATELNMVFHDGFGTWDNNNGADWHFAVTGGGAGEDPWEMDGAVDADAALVAENGGVQLYAGIKGNQLYVAAPDAGSGEDHFIFVAAVPGAPVPAPWAKAGQVAAWSAMLANENDNLWSGWQGTSAANQSANGAGAGYLEGTLDVAQHFGGVPEVVHLAFAAYGTANDGPLAPDLQAPPSTDGDGDVDASEFVAVRLICRGDANCDGLVNFQDIPYLKAALGDNEAAWRQLYRDQHAGAEPTCHWQNNNVNGAGGVNFQDIPALKNLLGTGCAP